MLRSLPVVQKRSDSAGLNLTDVTVSEPHEKLLMGSERLWSHMSTCTPPVANMSFVQWWSVHLKPFFPWNSSTGSSSSSTGPITGGANGTFHSLTVQSSLQVTALLPSWDTAIPRMAPLCPTKRRRQRWAGMSHSLMSPLAQPEMMLFSLAGFLARLVTASSCVKELTKGLANTRSSLAALRALVYSFAFSKGCSEGSRFLWTFCTSCDRSRV
mmetsp:Transcript_11501/g.32623  ORF Transcript_11501/g.32623 Transcript_11501/m.32623 type:complete len:213 (+) Transcript_11501:808-1446(+)